MVWHVLRLDGGEDDKSDDDIPPSEQAKRRYRRISFAIPSTDRYLHSARREADETAGIDEVSDEAASVSTIELVIPVSKQYQRQTLRQVTETEADDNGKGIEGEHQSQGDLG